MKQFFISQLALAAQWPMVIGVIIWAILALTVVAYLFSDGFFDFSETTVSDVVRAVVIIMLDLLGIIFVMAACYFMSLPIMWLFVR